MTGSWLGVALLAALAGCSSAGDRCQGGARRLSATVTVVPGTAAGRLTPGFVGFSFEKSHLSDAFFTGANAPLIAMFKLLGPGVLRIGANDVDRSTWQPDAPSVAAGTTSDAVGTLAVDGLADFLTATGWRAIYGVNLKTGTPAAAVAEASYVATRLGSNLVALELGNELNFYSGSYVAIRTSWEDAAAAVRAALPGVPLAAPASAGDVTFATTFARDEGAQLTMLTHHYYRGSASAGTASIDSLLAVDPAVRGSSQALAVAATSNALRDGFRWGEVNSYAGHGAAGVSDAFVSALWGVDFMLTSAALGAAGVNFHGGGQNMDGNICTNGVASCTRPFRYSPIIEVDSHVTAAAPLYHGMLFVAQMGAGDLLTTQVAADGLALSAYALGADDASTVVALINKDQRCGISVAVDVAWPVASASALTLEAPSLGETDGVTLGGAAVTPDGAWTPLPPRDLPSNGHGFTVDVAAASAVLIRARQ